MDRRFFLLGAFGLAACQRAGGVTLACDPDLAAPLDAALAAWKRRGRINGYAIRPLDARRLLEMAETTPGLVVVTREPKLADRLQRTNRVRLQSRWKPKIGGGEVQVVVTRGDGEAHGVAFAKWLMTDEGAAALGGR